MPTLVNVEMSGSNAKMVENLDAATTVVNKATWPATVRRTDRHLEEENVGNQDQARHEEISFSRNAMPKTGIEPYRPLHPTIRELMEARPAGADDGGIPLKEYLGRPPKSAYRTMDRAEAQRRLRAREIQVGR